MYTVTIVFQQGVFLDSYLGIISGSWIRPWKCHKTYTFLLNTFSPFHLFLGMYKERNYRKTHRREASKYCMWTGQGEPSGSHSELFVFRFNRTGLRDTSHFLHFLNSRCIHFHSPGAFCTSYAILDIFQNKTCAFWSSLSQSGLIQII